MKKLLYTLLVCTVFFGCDNETIELVDMYVQEYTFLEGDAGTTAEFVFVVKLLSASTVDVTFDYKTEDIKAEAGTDYTAVSGTATIPVGELETTILVTVMGDSDWEVDENFRFEISNANNVNLITSFATGVIRNDDKSGFFDTDGYITPDSQSGMTLTWSDEFNGSDLNLTDWTYETGDHGWGNNELQDYRSGSNNTTVANGKLTITAKDDPMDGYTSARLITKDKQTFKYGRIDIRAKLPQGQGIWPALWMLGNNINEVSWPACGEIDIMELVGHEPSKTHGTIHWADVNGNHTHEGGGTSLSGEVFADAFHVFTILWDSQKIVWYLDEEQFHSEEVNSGGREEFHHPHFFIFNIAVGGNWPGSPDGTTVFPQTMEVDYIRVFQ